MIICFIPQFLFRRLLVDVATQPNNHLSSMNLKNCLFWQFFILRVSSSHPPHKNQLRSPFTFHRTKLAFYFFVVYYNVQYTVSFAMSLSYREPGHHKYYQPQDKQVYQRRKHAPFNFRVKPLIIHSKDKKCSQHPHKNTNYTINKENLLIVLFIKKNLSVSLI